MENLFSSVVGGGLWVFILPVVILMGMGIFIIRRNTLSQEARQAASSWPSTTGTVVMSTVNVRYVSGKRKLKPVVEYTYQVNGLNYQGKYIRVGDQFVTFRTAVDPYLIPVRYPMGASVTVYYNPANPVEAGLER
jgi:hypothetical protein